MTPTSSPTARRLLHYLDRLGPLLALVLIFLFFLACIGPKFASFDNIQTIAIQSTIVCMAGLGMTFIIISAGIDLSIGSAVAMVAVAVAVLLKWKTTSAASGPSAYLTNLHPIAFPLVIAIGGILIGALCGLLNGLLITTLRLAPFIITLGTMMIFRGLAKAFSHQQAVNPPNNWLADILSFPAMPQWIETSPARSVLQWLYLAPGIWATLLLAIIMSVILSFTRFGRHVIAIGSNEQTARLCGIPVASRKILVYTLGGVFAGCAALMQYSRTNQGSPTANVGLELDVIAAVVIGGASLSGGKGSILGTIVGSLIMTVIGRGCSQVPIPLFLRGLTEGNPTGLPTYIQEIVTGLIIIIAVALDRIRR
ncbi:MAG TPA: ABC transporter permease [Tepidisphaeraceae bacterium]|jgi:ribose/xylose/arabinose/galactoside ABC-type transport system permease subunit